MKRAVKKLTRQQKRDESVRPRTMSKDATVLAKTVVTPVDRIPQVRGLGIVDACVLAMTAERITGKRRSR
jgi:hypothetical protein